MKGAIDEGCRGVRGRHPAGGLEESESGGESTRRDPASQLDLGSPAEVVSVQVRKRLGGERAWRLEWVSHTSAGPPPPPFLPPSPGTPPHVQSTPQCRVSVPASWTDPTSSQMRDPLSSPSLESQGLRGGASPHPASAPLLGEQGQGSRRRPYPPSTLVGAWASSRSGFSTLPALHIFPNSPEPSGHLFGEVWQSR